MEHMIGQESYGVGGIFHDFQSIVAELVECAELWHRTPGAGSGPWATDGPWRQMQQNSYWFNYDAGTGKPEEQEETRPPRLPLSVAEVARRDRVSEWLRFVSLPANRKLVVLVVVQLARGEHEDRIEWSRLLKPLGQARGAGGLRQRWETAIHQICVAVNAGRDPQCQSV